MKNLLLARRGCKQGLLRIFSFLYPVIYFPETVNIFFLNFHFQMGTTLFIALLYISPDNVYCPFIISN